jgi:hypothetical protein
VGLRDRFRRLQKVAERDTITFQLQDGTTARFYEEEVWPECFLQESARWGTEDPGPAHPFVETLRDAAERGGVPGVDARVDYPDAPR